jgi:hypothetical protein
VADYLSAETTRFVARRVDWAELLRLRGEAGHVDDEVRTVLAVLRTAADVAADIAADARPRWHDPARLVGDRVAVPAHVAAGYERLRRAGLLCVSLGREHGGLGLPFLVHCAILELVARADASLMTIVGLQAGVAVDIERYGSDALKRAYLPRFASGELQGAMDLTEPGAGSDLGRIATRVTAADGKLFVEGEKIFITNGGSAVHLVLARDAVAPTSTAGTPTGLSLVLCPTELPDGRPNGVRVTRVEEKLGLHGSPTCVVRFDRAEGFPLGPRGGGFRAMLDLMNLARLGVAAQAVGIAEGAYQAAAAHAAARVQFGRALNQHPLMTAMLAEMRVDISAARALLHRTGALLDRVEALRAYLRSERGRADPALDALRREHLQQSRLVRVLTSLSKYVAGEMSRRVTAAALQAHGGIGYMADAAVGQAHLDALVTTIYEGTSEIQVTFAAGELARGVLPVLLDSLAADVAAARDAEPDLAAHIAAGAGWLATAAPPVLGDPHLAQLHAARIGRLAGDLLAAAELLRQACLEPACRDAAAAFIADRAAGFEIAARQLASGDAAHLDRCARLVAP